ncbi:chalcone isomerase family protein [Caenimonas terrae]|uniref:Chalcone isomerase family protein n=1 Tax=Caenimonas terrae TaxID=696074 RepID=A0ABW0N7R3_9BURK
MLAAQLLAAAALALGAPCALRAQPAPGVGQFVPSAQAAGSARLRFWGLEVYDASLWVAPGFRPADFSSHRFALELRYLRGFSGADIAQRSLDEMRRVGGFSAAQAAQWQSALARLLPNVAAGDSITGINRPGSGVLFLSNGRPLGEIGDAHFARLFFGIWLAPSTSEPALRTALLAGSQR